MIEKLFFTVLEVSVSVGIAAAAILLLSPFSDKKYTAAWRYLIWIVLAVRLMIPFNWNLPRARFEVSIPSQVTFTSPWKAEDTQPHAERLAETDVLLDAEAPAEQIHLASVLALLWGAGCVTAFATHLFSYVRCRKIIRRQGIPVENREILRQLDKLQEELGIRRKVTVKCYSGVSSPMAVGFFKPLLILPREDYASSELVFILKHELVHLMRHDMAVKLLFAAASAVHWFNPLIYMMRKKAFLDMELACDERVVQGMGEDGRRAYAEALLSVLCGAQKKEMVFSAHFLGGTKIMMMRFQGILDKKGKRNGAPLLCACCVLMLAAGMLVGCQSVEPNRQPTQLTGEDYLRGQPENRMSGADAVQDVENGDNQHAQADSVADSSDNRNVASADGEAGGENASSERAGEGISEEDLEAMETALAELREEVEGLKSQLEIAAMESASDEDDGESLSEEESQEQIIYYELMLQNLEDELELQKEFLKLRRKLEAEAHEIENR